jgi:hypothetical protein
VAWVLEREGRSVAGAGRRKMREWPREELWGGRKGSVVCFSKAKGGMVAACVSIKPILSGSCGSFLKRENDGSSIDGFRFRVFYGLGFFMV